MTRECTNRAKYKSIERRGVDAYILAGINGITKVRRLNLICDKIEA